MKIQGRARLRKCAVVLESLERTLLTGRPSLPGVPVGPDAARYAAALASALVAQPDCSPQIAEAAARLEKVSFPSEAPPATQSREAIQPREFIRALDSLRHLCMRHSGQSTADWDLIDPGLAAEPQNSQGPGQERKQKQNSQRPGQEQKQKQNSQGPDSGEKRLRAYLEDIRSPFNVGSIFRSAEAFGFAEIILSPDCADPEHPRALRSAMGAVGLVPWRRAALEDIADKGPFFALELGGESLDDFAFPVSGTVILGSEELGVSDPALAVCALGKVSIPMRGAKASLNVAVAFGILAHRWAGA
ncbi:MAG: TrmH family RNA methyltransferase [Rectinemataceae bacterium]